MNLNTDLLKSHKIIDWSYSEEDIPLSYQNYLDWVTKGKHGPLGYLADDRMEKRQTLKEYFPEFQSALVFLFDYSNPKQALDEFYKSNESNGHKIAGYVFGFDGLDYHHTIKKSMNDILENLKQNNPGLEGVLSLDIHPVLERDLAYRSGLGWFGKNSMFISRKHGSFVMIGSILLNQKIAVPKEYLETDHCGQCTACADACPTLAIDPVTRTLESSKCISTFTIEVFKEGTNPPENYQDKTKEIFGCDICQDVCPWNKRIFRNRKKANVDLSTPMSKKLINFFLKRKRSEVITEIESWSNRQYQREFKGTPLERTGRIGMLKNLKIFNS